MEKNEQQEMREEYIVDAMLRIKEGLKLLIVIPLFIFGKFIGSLLKYELIDEPNIALASYIDNGL
jgi:hypothetical protein